MLLGCSDIQGNEGVPNRQLRLCLVATGFAAPATHHVGVQPIGQGDGRGRCARLLALLNHLCTKFWGVGAPGRTIKRDLLGHVSTCLKWTHHPALR